MCVKIYVEQLLIKQFGERTKMRFPFCEVPETAAITCCHVLNDKKSILYVSHDEEDGMWQFLCGRQHEIEDARLVSLKSVFDMDNTVGKLFDMSCGCHAERASIKDDWVIN